MLKIIKPDIAKIMPGAALIMFTFFWTRIVGGIAPDYLWRSLVIHIPLAYLFTCLFFWFAKPAKKWKLTVAILLSLVCLVVSFSVNILLYKGMAKAYSFMKLSEINPKILSYSLRWNAGLFISLILLCSSYMWIYFYLLNKKYNLRVHRETQEFRRT